MPSASSALTQIAGTAWIHLPTVSVAIIHTFYTLQAQESLFVSRPAPVTPTATLQEMIHVSNAIQTVSNAHQIPQLVLIVTPVTTGTKTLATIPVPLKHIQTFPPKNVIPVINTVRYVHLLLRIVQFAIGQEASFRILNMELLASCSVD